MSEETTQTETQEPVQATENTETSVDRPEYVPEKFWENR
jgi:hypothetical protein